MIKIPVDTKNVPEVNVSVAEFHDKPLSTEIATPEAVVEILLNNG
jgi:hypothetical protein